MFFSKLLPILLSLSVLQPIAPIPKDPLDYDSSKPLGNNVVPIDVSVSQFENAYKQDILLPRYIPFTPTHTGGHFNKALQMITVDYLNQKTNELLSMSIHLQTLPDLKTLSKNVTLADGTEAKYFHAEKYMSDFLSFKKNDLTYEIGIKKNGEKKLDELVEVANSLE